MDSMDARSRTNFCDRIVMLQRQGKHGILKGKATDDHKMMSRFVVVHSFFLRCLRNLLIDSQNDYSTFKGLIEEVRVEKKCPTH